MLLPSTIAKIAALLNCAESSMSYKALGGGSINEVYRIETSKSAFICKLNSSMRYPRLFEKEVQGLEYIRGTKTIRVPEVIAVGETEGQQLLLLEFIEEGVRDRSFWRRFGQQLAWMHEHTSSQCGFEEDNYMGALPQLNGWMDDWPAFFTRRRLQPQVELALAAGLLREAHIVQFERMYSRIPELFPRESYSLLHGDLWSGNFLCDRNGSPVLIDPAVYFGSRHMDLAMTTLFGGFDSTFYEAYYEAAVINAEARLVWDVCNVYPLLIHLNLFGRSYLSSIMSTVGQF